jgi:hypothetical protein
MHAPGGAHCEGVVQRAREDWACRWGGQADRRAGGGGRREGACGVLHASASAASFGACRAPSSAAGEREGVTKNSRITSTYIEDERGITTCTVEATCKADWPARKRSTEAEHAPLERAAIQNVEGEPLLRGRRGAEAEVDGVACTVEATCKADWPTRKRSTEAEHAPLERAAIQNVEGGASFGRPSRRQRRLASPKSKVWGVGDVASTVQHTQSAQGAPGIGGPHPPSQATSTGICYGPQNVGNGERPGMYTFDA